MRSDAPTVDEYLAELPPERRDAIAAVRRTALDSLPDGYCETMDFGMISYVIPLEDYPKTYNKHPLMLAAIASQKRYMAVYLNNIYSSADTARWFLDAYHASGKKLDMGKSCVRFKTLDDLPLALIGRAIARTPAYEFIALYEASRRKGGP